MDERHWVRMVVCFLPGLVVGKAAGYVPGNSFVTSVATLFLIAGVATYLLWSRIRARTNQVDAGVDEDSVEVMDDGEIVEAVSGAQVLQHLAQLRALCGETERESDRAIAMELALNPDLSFGEAAHNALVRKQKAVK